MAIKPTTISSSYRNRKCSLSRADLEDFSLRGHCAKRKILEGYKSGQSVKNTDLKLNRGGFAWKKKEEEISEGFAGV